MKAISLTVLAGLVAAALTGCSGPPAGPKVASARSAPTGHTGSTASPTPTDTDYDKALRYTRCMTAHGATMPDPVAGKALPVQGTSDNGWMTSETEPFKTCRVFLPATWPVKVDPQQIAKERRFNECLRQHGVAILEPDENGMVNYPADPFENSEQPDTLAAEEACRYLYDDPANHQDRG